MVLQFVHYSEGEKNSPAQLAQMKTFAAWFLFLTFELSFFFPSIIPAIFFLWSFLWTYCDSKPFIPLNVLVYEVLQYTFSLTLEEYDISAEKADTTAHHQISILFGLKHHDCHGQISFWTSIGHHGHYSGKWYICINSRMNCTLRFIRHFHNGWFFN